MTKPLDMMPALRSRASTLRSSLAQLYRLPGAEDFNSYKFRRVRELLIAAEAIIPVTILTNQMALGQERSVAASGVLTLLLALVFYFHARLRPGHEDRVLTVLLFCGIGAISAVMWLNEGLRDPCVTAYPIILAYCGALLNARLYRIMLGCIMGNILLIAVCYWAGLVSFPNAPFNWSQVSDFLMILSITGYSIYVLSNDIRNFFMRFRDENEKVRQSEAEILRLLHHDGLTGLPNRVIVKQALAAIALSDKPEATLFFIDLDNFKSVNDTLGHGAGDELLKAIANRLKAAVPPDCTICRNGGDEFLLLAPGSCDLQAAISIAEHILGSAAVPVDIEGTSLVPTFSMGIARMPEDGTDFEVLQRKADIALYSAKAGGRNIFRIYDESMNANALAHLSLAAKLRTALSDNEFRIFYQPKVSLETGRIDGAEALLRWFPKSGERFSPDQFIPVAENTGSIVEIGKWVLKEACRQCRAWQRQGFDGLKMSVNISAVQFRRGNLGQVVAEALREAELDARFLELELTESLLFDDQYNISGQIAEIRQLGVTFSIDDFGKGYSNLGYLGRLDIGTLKIDRQFVAHMLDSERDHALVGAIFAIAKALQLKTVAEGVETLECLETLKAFGCSSAQGFYWSKPVDAETFEAFAAGNVPQQLRA